MSDLVDGAAAALGLPASLVERSAAARAAETGASVDDILAAWSGGAPPPVATAPAAAESEAPTPEPAAEPEVVEPAAAVAVMEAPPEPATVEVVVEEEPDEPLEPVAIGDRMRTATRVGGWTGAGLGLVAFLMASSFWAPDALVLEDSGPVVNVESANVVIGMAIVSVVFGAIVAGFSRAAAGWSNPAMQLQNSKASTAWIGALLGLVLGVIAGVLLLSFGTSLEGTEGNIVQLPVLPTLGIMLIGGAVLGAVTAAAPQMFGTPVAVDEDDQEEVEVVKDRLGGAMGIPMVAMVILVVLVIPFGYLLIEANHLSGNGAGIVAILTSGAILGFAALSGSKPNMKITLGDLMWALLAIGTVLVIVVSVLFYVGNSDSEEHFDDGGEGGEAAIVQLF